MQSLALHVGKQGKKPEFRHTCEASTHSEDGFTLPSRLFVFYSNDVEIFRFDYCDSQTIDLRDVAPERYIGGALVEKSTVTQGTVELSFRNSPRRPIYCPMRLMPYLLQVTQTLLFKVSFTNGLISLCYDGSGTIWNSHGDWRQAQCTEQAITLGDVSLLRERVITGPQAKDLSGPAARPIWRKLIWCLRGVAPTWVEQVR